MDKAGNSLGFNVMIVVLWANVILAGVTVIVKAMM